MQKILASIFTGIIAAIFTMGAIALYLDKTGRLYSQSIACEDSSTRSHLNAPLRNIRMKRSYERYMEIPANGTNIAHLFPLP